VYDQNGTITNRKTLSRQATLLPKVEGVPRYKDFNTIRKNNHVKDDDVLRYVPYFGEEDDIDLTEVYKVEVRTVEEEEDLERILTPIREVTLGSKILARIVERYLEINDVTPEQTLSALSDDIRTSPPTPLEAKIIKLAVEWRQKTELELYFVIESYSFRKTS
jgi:hypothetical protein